MLITKKSLVLLANLGSLAFTHALNPLQVAMKNLGYENEGYRILKSNHIDSYSVRIKNNPKSCEQGVQYSGYIDRHDTDDHFFFYFFESRSNPSTDPTILWLNGGPGCSSMIGLWMELGPCLVNEYGNDTVKNPYSWNTAANIFFLDQPINVGFSYGKSQVTNARDAARDVYAFLQLFFTEFSQYAKSPFHITGESYAGRYLPSISTEIIRNNKALSTEKDPIRINLESVVIGNGWVNPRVHMKNYEKFACSHDSIYQPLLDESTCEEMRYQGLHCKDLMDTCYENPSASICVPAYTYCLKIYEDPLAKTGINMYDIRKKCESDNGMCYKNIDAIRTYANLEHVRKELGIDEHIENYSECNQTVEFNFDSNGDHAMDSTALVAETLEAGVPVLLYVGVWDWNCNWFGNLEWSSEMEWSGKKGFNDASFKKWYSDISGENAGEVKQYGGLTFLKVFDAGHLVPFDQPENSLDFFNKWLSSISLSSE